MNIEQARTQMIEQQVRAWEVLDEAVLDTIQDVPREEFVPYRYKSLAFADTSIPLPHGQSMMTPKMEGRTMKISSGPSANPFPMAETAGMMTKPGHSAAVGTRPARTGLSAR